MNHVYQYNGYSFSSKNKKDALEYYIDESGDDDVLTKYFKKRDDKYMLDIMLTENDNKEIDSGNLNIPENSAKRYLGEEDGYEDYTWIVYARCGDWAKINDGFLCKDIE